MARHRSTYTGRYNGIGRLLQNPGVQRATAQAAQRMQRIAEFLSPVGDPATDPHPGQYQNSFAVVPVTKNVPFRGKPRLRAGSRLINTARYARDVEYGNGKVQRYAVLRTALDAARVIDG
ncbi:hypothetical protein ACFVHB_20025 [Kitasatospora sp. NPDC127111]|uniref:hypothetical protein n=1 Tax=Kitasatospora sp. NPDC127111 TaxID=3345363 RepID=UPI00362CC5A4